MYKDGKFYIRDIKYRVHTVPAFLYIHKVIALVDRPYAKGYVEVAGIYIPLGRGRAVQSCFESGWINMGEFVPTDRVPKSVARRFRKLRKFFK